MSEQLGIARLKRVFVFDVFLLFCFFGGEVPNVNQILLN